MLGPRHPDTLTTRANLANSYRSAGRINDAITLMQQAIDDAAELEQGHPFLDSWIGELADWRSIH